MEKSKELRFKVGFDAQGVEKDLKKVEQVIKNMQRELESSSKAGSVLKGDKLMSSYAQSAFGDFSKESQKNMKDYYDQLRRHAVNEQVTIRGKSQELEKLQKVEGDLTKQQQKRVELLKEEISLLKDKQRETISALATTKEAMGGDFEKGDFKRSDFSKFLRRTGLGKMASIGGTALMGGIAMAQQLDPIMQRYIERDRSLLADQSGATRLANQPLYAQLQGRGSTNFYEADINKKAMDMALKETQAQSIKDPLMAGGRVATGLASAYLGAKAGAGLGALGGTAMFPGVGTILGGAAGAIAGGIGGFQLGSGGLFGDKRAMNSLFDRDAYNALSTKEGFEKYQQNKQNLKFQEFGKYVAQEDFLSNYRQYQGVERQLGMQGNQLYPWMEQGLGAGFTKEEMFGSASGILQSGGSTAMARNAMVSNQMKRDYAITNADQILGRLSGSGMTTKQSEDATKRLLSEAVAAGFDMSESSEETRRFLQASADLIYQSGGNTSMAGMLASGITSTSQRGLEQALGANQGVTQMLGDMSGYSGALKWSYLASQEGQELFGKVDPRTMQVLMGDATIDESDPQLRQAARQQYGKGAGEKEIKKFMRDLRRGMGKGVGLSQEFDTALSEYESVVGDMGGVKELELLKSGGNPELERAWSKLAPLLQSEKGIGTTGKDFERAVSMRRQLSGYEDASLTTDLSSLEGQKRKLTAADLQGKSEATDQLATIQKVAAYIGDLAKAAEANTTSSASIAKALEEYVKLLKDGKSSPELLQTFRDLLNQYQANSPMMLMAPVTGGKGKGQ
jgi:hypothetical protein